MFKATNNGFQACPDDFIKLQFCRTNEACEYVYANKNPGFIVRFFGICYAASWSLSSSS